MTPRMCTHSGDNDVDAHWLNDNETCLDYMMRTFGKVPDSQLHDEADRALAQAQVAMMALSNCGRILSAIGLDFLATEIFERRTDIEELMRGLDGYIKSLKH